MSSVLEQERRTGQSPIPADITRFMNTSQTLSLHQLESFGWHIKFVRHPLFQQPEIFIADSNNEVVGMLLEDGTVSNDDMPTLR